MKPVTQCKLVNGINASDARPLVYTVNLKLKSTEDTPHHCCLFYITMKERRDM